MTDKRERQDGIVELLARNRIDSQEQLRDLLQTEGVDVAQSTLSRDLRELGILKGPEGYRLPTRRPEGKQALRAAAAAVADSLRSVDAGCNVVVLQTPDESEARTVAAQLERARLHQVTAAVPCGATVLVIARTTAFAREIVRELRERPRTRARIPR